ncbi:MAG: MATE family efflux transporter [Eubacteriales bacterium]
MNILGKDFNAKSLMMYVLPTILMMIFMSTYTIIDGLFVANLVGEDALSAVNVVWPSMNVLLAMGLMFATGGTAIMGRLMGEGKVEEARSFLSILYIVAILLGAIISGFYLCFLDNVLLFLGAKDELYPYAKDYLRTLSIFATSFFLQVYVQSFFVLAGKPVLGFATCLAGGLTNIALDYICISPKMLDMGIAGAGVATGIGNLVPAIFGIIYFFQNKNGTIYFGKPVFNGKLLFQSMFNGVSELVSQLAAAITTLLFNVILLDLVGKSGVASISVILYIQMFQIAIYFGYSIGVAPIIAYKYGAGDQKGLQNVIRISFRFIAIVSILVISGSLLLDDLAVGIFIDKTSETFQMAKEGLRLFSLGYIFMGMNIFLSSMFTAFSNGRVSATLSITRTFVFLVSSLIILTYLWQLNGVWLAVPVAELLAFFLSIYYYKKGKVLYGY